MWAVEDSDKPLSVRTVEKADVNVTDAESVRPFVSSLGLRDRADLDLRSSVSCLTLALWIETPTHRRLPAVLGENPSSSSRGRVFQMQQLLVCWRRVGRSSVRRRRLSRVGKRPYVSLRIQTAQADFSFSPVVSHRPWWAASNKSSRPERPPVSSLPTAVNLRRPSNRFLRSLLCRPSSLQGLSHHYRLVPLPCSPRRPS